MSIWSRNEPEIKTEATSGEVKPPEKTPAELIAESLATALKPVTDTLGAISGRLEAVETATRRPEREIQQTETPSVFDNEDAAFAQRIGPVMLRQYELEARMVRDDIRREYERAGHGDVWAQYEGEINSQLEGSALVQPDGHGGVRPLRGDPGYIKNIVNMIIGAAAVKAGMRFDGKNKTFFLESAGGDSGGSHAIEAQDGLNPDQRRVTSRMGLTPDQVKKSMSKLKFVN